MNASYPLELDGPSKNQVTYCTFSNAVNTALAIYDFAKDFSTNDVSFCTFQNVSNAISMSTTYSITANITSCSFSNCSTKALYPEPVLSQG